MNRLNLRIAIVVLGAMTAFAAVCRAQLDDPSPATKTSDAASGQDASSSAETGQPAGDGTEQPVSAAPAGASSWTAGASSFKPSSDAGWGGKNASFGTAGAKSWTAETGNFAEPVQPGGIWREKALPLPARKPSALASMHPSSAPSFALRPGAAHPALRSGRSSRPPHAAGARRKHGAPAGKITHGSTGSAHSLDAPDADSSGFAGSGVAPQ